MEARGRVITFYAYKGGTGRSMAVANTAYLLSRRADVRKGVLMIDWDLDAPGLHWFFATNAAGVGEDRFSLKHDGVVELFGAIRDQIPSGGEEPISEEATEHIVRQIDLKRFIVDTGVPKVHLMPAGRFGGDYSRAVGLFDWRGLFKYAPSAIRNFAETVAEKYDYVLIDSRTGLNDISGICTALLPDHLVIVFTPNRQSLVGGIEAAEHAVAYRRESEDIRPLTVYPLPSRVEMSEPDLAEKWRFGDTFGLEDIKGYQARFEALFRDTYSLPSCDLKNYFDEVQIQHVPRYSYGEEIAAQHERGTRLSLSRSYATFADILIKGEPPWEVPRTIQEGAALVSDARPSEAKVQAAKDYLAEDRFRLKLEDLIAGEVKGVLAELSRLPIQGAATVGAFADRLHAYETATNDLLLLEALLGYWGVGEQRKVLVLGPRRIYEQVEPTSGLTLYLAARAYPALLLLYCGGIAAIAGGRFENLRDLMLFPVNKYHGDPDSRTTFVVAVSDTILELERMNLFKELPGLARRHTPKSDYLYSVIKPLLSDLLLAGSDFDQAFDRFEVLYALEYCNQKARGESPHFWGPIGRFGWKRAAFNEVIKEAESQRQEWEPIRSGLFDSSFARFRVVSSGFADILRHVNMF